MKERNHSHERKVEGMVNSAALVAAASRGPAAGPAGKQGGDNILASKNRPVRETNRDGGGLQVISALSLVKRYGPGYELVLEDYLEESEREKGRRKFVVTKALPTRQEYEALERACFEKPMSVWLANAAEEVGGLQAGYEDWLGNMPEAFQCGSKACELETVIEELGDFEIPELPPWTEGIPLFHRPLPGSDSKPKRLAEVGAILEQCAEELLRLVETGAWTRWLPCQSIQALGEERIKKELTDLGNDLHASADEIDLISLPGMF